MEESEEYRILDELEQLETLREEMLELGVSTLAEVEDRLRWLHARLDELEAER